MLFCYKLYCLLFLFELTGPVFLIVEDCTVACKIDPLYTSILDCTIAVNTGLALCKYLQVLKQICNVYILLFICIKTNKSFLNEINEINIINV